MAFPRRVAWVRIAVFAAACAAVFFLLRMRSLPAARAPFELPYGNPLEMPDIPLGLLALGVGMLVGDYAARVFERGTFRGAVTVVRFAELARSPWTQFGLCMLAVPSTLSILFCALFTPIFAFWSSSSIPAHVVALFVALASGSAVGAGAIWAGILIPRERFQSSRTLRRLVLSGLVAGAATAFPLTQIAPVLAWPAVFLLLFTRLFVLHYAITAIFLVLAVVGMGRLDKSTVPRADT